MAVKLLAIDLDDTLLNTDLEIAPACVEAIMEAKEKGVIVTLATGRMNRSAIPYAEQLEIAIPVISYQGALLKNPISGEIMYYKPILKNMGEIIIEYFRKQGVHYHSYFDDSLYMERLSEEGKLYSALSGVKPIITDDLLASLQERDALKIMAISDNESFLLEMEFELKEQYGTELHITRSKPYFLEVMHQEADKANALQVLAEYYGIDRKEVMSIGDSYNDLAMIEWSGLGIAMGNAREIVKEAADFVTTSNVEDGVAQAIRKYVLK